MEGVADLFRYLGCEVLSQSDAVCYAGLTNNHGERYQWQYKEGKIVCFVSNERGLHTTVWAGFLVDSAAEIRLLLLMDESFSRDFPALAEKLSVTVQI